MLELKFFSKTAHRGHVLRKSTHLLFGARSFLLVHIMFTPGEGPKGFVKSIFLRNRIMEKGHGPWCNLSLSLSLRVIGSHSQLQENNLLF